MLVLITGTDTGIGKTVATCAIIDHALAAGALVSALKPIETGYADIGDDRSDTIAIVNALNRHCKQRNQSPVTIQQINLYSFYSPVAPQVAAPHEGKAIEWDKLLQFIQNADAPERLTIVEGSGGPLVPICKGKTYIELAIELKMAAIVVVGSKLGCINHTLLTISELKNRNIPILGYIFNELGVAEAKESSEVMVSRETNRALIAELLMPFGIDEIGYIPYLKCQANRDAIVIQPFWKGLLACR